MKHISTIVAVWLLAGGAWAGDSDSQKSAAPSGTTTNVVTNPVTTDIDWQKNYDSALEKAKKDNKLVLVDIYTDWCGWCKKLDRDTYSDTNVQAKVAKDFIAVKINPEKSAAGQKLQFQLGVRGYPFIAFMDADGKKIAQIGGYVDAAAFLKQLEQVSKPDSAKRNDSSLGN